MNTYLPNLPHLLTLLVLMVFFLVMFVSYWGYGRFLFRLVLPETTHSLTPAITAITGWAVALGLIQLTHLFTPIVAPISVGFLMLGVGLAAMYRKDFRIVDIVGNNWISVGILFLVLFYWILSKALLFPEVFDSKLYHFNMIRWISEYSVVPGLGNLHGRLGFNQAFFTYGASLNFIPYLVPVLENGRFLANSFILMTALVISIEGLQYAQNKAPTLKPNLLWILYVLTLFCLLYHLFDSRLTSPTPDMAVGILIILAGVLFFDLLIRTRDEDNYEAIVLTLFILTATAVTVKLSSVVFSFLLFLSLLFVSWNRIRVSRLLVFAGCTCPIILVWIIKGYITTGCPLFPSSIGCLMSLDWSMNPTSIRDEATLVYAFARNPYAHWTEVSGSWAWFPRWWGIFSSSVVSWIVLYSFVLGLVGLVIRFLRPQVKFSMVEKGCLLLFLVSFVALVFWFLTAPAIRFAQPIIFVLLMAAHMFLMAGLYSRLYAQKYPLLIIVLCAVTISFFPMQLPKDLDDRNYKISATGNYGLPDAEVESWTTKSGLKINVSKSETFPWNSVLPATIQSRFDPYLELRTPGNIQDGFKLSEDRPEKHLE